MKLPFEIYNPEWIQQFEEIKYELKSILRSINPSIDHIGSTAVEGLSAKPIIDIQIGVKNDKDLFMVPHLLKLPNIVYYEKFNADWPERRFFILLKRSVHEIGIADTIETGAEIPKILHDHDLRIAHIHVFVNNSYDWIRHIAFKEYLIAHPKIRDIYQELKKDLIKFNWEDGMDYNKGKDKFLKAQEKFALIWYKQNRL